MKLFYEQIKMMISMMFSQLCCIKFRMNLPSSHTIMSTFI